MSADLIKDDTVTLLKKAKATLEKNGLNAKIGIGGKNTISLSDQLNWDDAMKVLGMAYYKPEEALEMFEAGFGCQWENGFLPQLETEVSSGSEANNEVHIRQCLTRPPIQGYLLWRLYELLADKEQGKAFLQKLYPKVLAFHRYLYQHRDPEEEGIVYIRHPWESGMDQSPVWDTLKQGIDPDDLRTAQLDDTAALGPFAVQDPFFNSLLTWSNESLIKVGGELKEDISEVLQWHELTIYSLNEKLWDEERGIYNAFDLVGQQIIPVTSIAGVLPMVGEVPTQDQAESILCTLESGMFGGKSRDSFLCPTNSMHSATLNFQLKWRGSVSLLANWMLLESLYRYDMNEMAKQVKNDMLNLCSKYGFYEHYDPRIVHFRHLGYGREDDPVAAAVCLDVLMKEMVMV